MSAVANELPNRPSGRPVRRCPSCGETYPIDFSVCPRDATPLGAETETDPLIGTVLGNTYQIVKLVTAGGMGTLYEAEHMRLKLPVAVKVLHEAYARRQDALVRFQREASAAGQLRSEHVARAVDLLRTADGRPCLITEYLHGEDLQHRLDREGKLPPAVAIGLTRQLCFGVAVAHEAGIVHRDLKPSNIFLAERSFGGPIVKILDFGVAKVLDGDELTQTGALIGTPAYMAPEQALGADNVDHRADIYAIGAVLYHMLTGSPPYGENDATAALMGLLKGDAPRASSINKDLSQDLEGILETAMARDPQARQNSALALAEELAPYEPNGREPTRVSRPGAQPADVPSRRPRWVRPLAVLHILAASLLAAGWAAAFVVAAVFEIFDAARFGGIERGLLIAAPIAVGVVTLALGIRGLWSSWRSAPTIVRLSRALASSAMWGLLALGVAELGAGAWRGVHLGDVVPSQVEHLVALGVGAVAALLRYVWLRRSR